jgi:transcriptional regulator with GAF, ATPase, and Fis domain
MPVCTVAEPLDGDDRELAELSESLSAMASVVLGEETLDAVLDLVVSLADSTLPAVVGSSVSLLRTQGFETANASSGLVRDLDAEQYKSGQGPCVEAIRSGAVQRLVVGESTDRWPTFASKVGDAGIQTVLSVPLQSKGQTIGALNLYSSQGDILDPPAARLASPAFR